VFSCLGLISCIESCIFLCCLDLLVSTLAKRLTWILTVMKYFVSKGFPYKDQIIELFIVMVTFLRIPTRTIFNLPLRSITLTATYFSKARYSCAESAFQSQSIYLYALYENGGMHLKTRHALNLVDLGRMNKIKCI